MECFRDYTIDHTQNKGYALIPKREFNPELSAFSNLLLDLVDFKDRVRPLANDIARHDAAHTYQRRNVNDLEADLREFKEGITDGAAEQAAADVSQRFEEAGYSSLEIAEESAAEEPEAAEPNLEAAAETEAEDEPKKE